MPPIKLKLSLGGLKPAVAPSSSANASAGPSTPAAYVQSGPSTPRRSKSEKSDDEGPSLRVVLPLSGITPSTSAVSTPLHSTAGTPYNGTPASTPGHDGAPVKRKRGRPRKHPLPNQVLPGLPPPTAIPPHLATTPRSAHVALSPPTSTSTPTAYNVKLEPEYNDDPLSWPLSPSAEYGTPADHSTPNTPWREGSEDQYNFQRPQQKWKRVKKPFKELANKIMTEMRRKDEYGFFLEPVDADEYPGYFETIGGPDKAMDLGTMQRKIDEGEYNGIEELETDARLMHSAALAFNLPGTAAYREAEKVFKHGLKHIERSRPLVLTPSPSLSPSARPSMLPDSERVTPARTKEIKPEFLIPEAMLEFPANSAQAKAVGWNLTGGRRVRAKRLVRGREKFIGKWRDNLPDGSYDVAEMDDPADMLERLRTRTASSWKEVPDWVGMYEDDQDWWEWEGLGGPTGQPPLPGTARLKPKPLRMKTLNIAEFGRFEDVNREISQARAAALPDGHEMPFFSELDDAELMATHLRPDPPRGPKAQSLPPQNFVDVNAGKPALNYVYDVAFGDVRGEAYALSVKRFLEGATKDKNDEDKSALEEHVATNWHNGVLQTRLSLAANNAVNALSAAASSNSTPTPGVLESARSAYARLALRRLTSAENPLDLQPLLREPTDFMHVGVGGKSGVEDALKWVGDEIARVIRERQPTNGGAKEGDGDVDMAVKLEGGATKRRAEDEGEGEGAGASRAKRIKLESEVEGNGVNGITAEPNGKPVANAEPNATAPPNGIEQPVVKAEPPKPAADGEDGLRQLRLELVALSKFYPLASLKKMDGTDAARLLPANVRNLMTRPPPASAALPTSAPTSQPASPK